MTTSTPEGIGMGCWPTRDMRSCSLPDVTEDLAADAMLTRLAVGHETLVGGQDGDPHAAEHARHVGRLRVDAQTGLRHAPKPGDRTLAIRRVLHHDPQLASRSARIVL